MGYPQTPSTGPVLQSQEYYRLTTEVSQPGEIYESEVGGLAFVLGPDSDISTVLVTYFDGNNTISQTSQFVISPDRSLIGRVDARMIDSYPLVPPTVPNGRAARILFSIGDIYRESYVPAAVTVGDAISNVLPVLDIMQYFVPPPSLISQRSDRIFRFEYFEAPTVPGPGVSTFIKIPAFGRKSGTFTFLNRTAAAVSVAVYGVKFGFSKAVGGVGDDATFEDSLFTAAALAADAHAEFTYEASSDGLWDMFILELDGYLGTSFPITVQLSDDVL